jgi:AraC family transcriptional activator of pobA
MTRKHAHVSDKNTPLYCLESFSKKAEQSSFYIQSLKEHVNEHDFISKPHKHDFYLILYITRGTGQHTIDFTTYEISPGIAFLMTPGQMHSWNLHEDIEGFIMFFSRNFYQMHLSGDNLVEFPFYHSLNASPVVLTGEDAMIGSVINEMHKEYQTSDEPDLRMLRAYLDLLLLKLAKVYQSKNDTPLNATTFKLRKLEQLIEKNFIRLKQPGDYADLMNLSPSYLNDICKQNSSKTLSELIQQRVLLEAKRLFAYTDQNVNEVASRLNFGSASYFTKFFRKHTGLTPEDFKESVNRTI